MAVTPRFLSGSSNGRGIMITSVTAASGNLLHTAVTGASGQTFDEVYVYAQNLTTTSRLLTLNAGGTASGDKLRIQLADRGNGMYLVVPGFRYNGGVTVRAYATSASKVACHGYVNRKTS